GPGHAETLDTRINLATSPDPGRVYEEILRLFMADERINGVAGRAWNIADHYARFPQERVDECGFAHVRAAHHRDFWDVGRRDFGLRRHQRVERIQQVCYAIAMFRGK